MCLDTDQNTKTSRPEDRCEDTAWKFPTGYQGPFSSALDLEVSVNLG